LAGLSVNDWSDGASTVRIAVTELKRVLAVIVESVSLVTAFVEMANEALDFPCGTVTDTGTVVDISVLDSWTTKPPLGAAAFKVTNPVDWLPPTTVDALNCNDVTSIGFTARFAVCGPPLSEAVITATVGELTSDVPIGNVAEVWPAGTMTVAATDAVVELLESATFAPPKVAWPLRVIVPLDEFPPNTLVGLRVIDATESGLIVMAEVNKTPAAEADTVTIAWLVTAVVLTMNEADV